MDNRCLFTDDGIRCKGNAKERGLCSRHMPKPVEVKSVEPQGPQVRDKHAAPEGVDPVYYAGLQAKRMIAQEMQARTKRNEERIKRNEEGERIDDVLKQVPVRIVAKRTRADVTQIIDPTTGKPPASLKPGYIQRWVRQIDHMDRPITARTTDFEDYGYETVRDAAGQPIITAFGVAMQAPPAQYALRQCDRSPTGALNRDELLEATEELAESANRYANDTVARVVVGDDHTHGREYHGGGKVE